MGIRSIMLAGVSLAIATTAVAQDRGVWFRGTDTFGMRQLLDAAPKLAFEPSTGLLLGGTATSSMATFTGSPAPVRLTASGGEIRVCPASGQCGSWSTSGTVREGDGVQARRAGPTAPGQTVSVGIDGLGLIASFDATARSSAASLGSFAPKTVAPSDLAESALSTFTGWVSTRLTVSGGEVRVCASGGSCGSWTTSSDVHDGDQVQLRGVAGSAGTRKTVTASAGGALATFDITAEGVDDVPDAIAFGPAPVGMEPGAATSTIVTLAGLDEAPISITGGEYSLNGGSFTSSPGTAKSGDKVQIRTAVGSYGETKTATLDVGGVKASFSATVRAKDTRPDEYVLSGVTGVQPGASFEFPSVTLTGFDDAPISVVGGEYSLNGGGFTTAVGTARAGDRIVVRGNAGAFGETVSVTLDVGGVKGVASISTRPKDTAPDAYVLGTGPTGAEPGSVSTSNTITLAGFDDAPISISGSGASYSLNGASYTTTAGTAKPGDTVVVRLTAGAFGESRVATLDIGGVTQTWSAVVRTRDDAPDAFTFASVSNAVPGTYAVSTPVRLTGHDGVAVSIASGAHASVQYQICASSDCSDQGSTWKTAPTADVVAGSYARLRLRLDGYGETASATLAAGTVQSSFTISSPSKDITPDAFSFPSVTNVEPGQPARSTSVVLTGHDGIMLSVQGGGYQICQSSACTEMDAQPVLTTSASEVPAGTRIRLVTTPQGFGTLTVILTAGSATQTFTVTTRAKDETPAAFTFASFTGRDVGVRSTSSIAQLTAHDGILVSVTGHPSSAYQICASADCSDQGSTWRTQPTADVPAGSYVRVGITPDAFSATATATLTAGMVQTPFSVTSRAKVVMPDAFSFFTQVQGDVDLDVDVVSRPVRLTGHDGVDVSIAGGSHASAGYQVCATSNCSDQDTSTWLTGTTANVPNGAYVRMKLHSGATGTTVSGSLTAGGTTGAFSVKSRATDTLPDPFGFAGINNAASGVTSFDSEIVRVTGHEGVPVSISGGGAPQFRICADASCASVVRAFSTASSTLTNGQYVQLRAFKANIVNNNAAIVLTAGQQTGTWSITTQAQATSCASFGAVVPGCYNGGTGPGTFMATSPGANFRVMAMGGGAGGGAGLAGGGGSGKVVFAVCTIGAGTNVALTVGAGGAPGQPGGTTSISGCFSADGGKVNFFETGGAGGSGGGAAAAQGASGGTGGASGLNADGGVGGLGQGPSFTNSFVNFTLKQLTAGAAGAGGENAGGGGGGVVFTGATTQAASGTLPGSAKGGTGFGAGGGSGGVNASGTSGTGGAGAPGFVYVEW